MTTPRGFRDRSEDSLLTLIGDVPELVRNLVTAEVDSAKGWVKRTAKDVGVGAGWIVAALFFLFWSIPALMTFVIAGLASWWPVWLSALAVFIFTLIVVAVLVLLGLRKFRKVSATQNPAQSIMQDVREVRDEF